MAVGGGVDVAEEDGGEGEVGWGAAMAGGGRMRVLGPDHGTSEMRF